VKTAADHRLNRNPTLTGRQLFLWVAPMMAIAWTRTYAVLLPGIVDTFGFSPSQAGRFVATIEAGSVISVIVVAVVINRMGARRVLLAGLPLLASALTWLTFEPSHWTLVICLVSIGTGMAWATTGMNALMAETGPRRSLYLGILHSAYGVLSVLAPIVASAIVADHSWQTYYRFVAILAVTFCLMLLGLDRKQLDPDANKIPSETPIPDRSMGTSSHESTGIVSGLHNVFGICLGVFCIAGVHGIWNTWCYLYIRNVYTTSDRLSVLAPTLFWVGILTGRVGLTFLSQRWTCRRLLILSCFAPLLGLAIEHAGPSYSSALLALFFAGAGVSGSFQLGTAWVSERLPNQVGPASTAIMGCAWLGIGVCPWIAGVIIEEASYVTLDWLVVGLSLVALAAFSCSSSQTAQV